MELNDDQLEKVCNLIATKINNNNRMLWVDRQTHYTDHTWIAGEKAKREEEQAFRKKVIQSVTIWAAIIVVGFVAVAVWRSFLASIGAGIGS